MLIMSKKISFLQIVILILCCCRFNNASAYPPYGDPNQAYDKLPGTLDTYHVKWASPLAGGPLNVLFIVPYNNSREVVELRQRLELNYTVIMNAGNFTWSEGCQTIQPPSIVENGEYILNKLSAERLALAHKYDCIIIGKISWDVIPERFRKLIMEHVTRGCGLVYVSPHRFVGKANEHCYSYDKGKEATQNDFFYNIITSGNPTVISKLMRALPTDVIPLKAVLNKKEVNKLPRPPKAFGFRLLKQSPVCAKKSTHGKGSIIVLDYFDAEKGKIVANSLTPAMGYKLVLYDYYYALLSRAVLLASGKLSSITCMIDIKGESQPPPKKSTPWAEKGPDIKILRDKLQQTAINAKITRNNYLGNIINLELSLRDMNGKTLKSFSKTIRLEKDKKQISHAFSMPSLSGGDYLADLRVLNNKRQVLDFASSSFKVIPPVQIEKIKTDKERYKDKENIQGKVTFTKALSKEENAFVQAVDSWGRKVAKSKVILDESKCYGTFSIPINNPLSKLWDIECAIRDKNGILAQSSICVGIPQWKYDNFLVATIFAPMPDGRTGWKGFLYAKQGRKYGINTANIPYLYGGGEKQLEDVERAHINCILYADHFGEKALGGKWDFRKPYTKASLAEYALYLEKSLVTGKKLNPKEYPEKINYYGKDISIAQDINKKRDHYKKAGKFGFPFLWVTAENHLLGEKLSKECSGFSRESSKRFQEWCKEEYKCDLNALNKEWNTSFKDWKNISGIMLKEAVEKRQLPCWVAFRYFMRSNVYTNFFITYSDFIRDIIAPHLLTGHGGHHHFDYSSFNKHMTAGRLYSGNGCANSEFVTPAAQELRMAFAENEGFLIEAQYLNHWAKAFHSPLDNRRFVWQKLIRGFRGFDFENQLGFPTMGGFSLFTPDFSEPLPYFKNISNEIKRMQDGLGTLRFLLKTQRAPVAVLWSLENHYVSRLYPFEENAFTGAGHRNIFVDGGAIGDIFALFNSIRIKPQILSSKQILNGSLKKRGIKALILPYNKAMSNDEANKIKEFVKEGGLLVGTNNPGIYSRFGKKLKKSSLSELFPVFNRENIVRYGKGIAAYLPDAINRYSMRAVKGDYSGSDSVACLLKKYAGIIPKAKLLNAKGLPRRDTYMNIFSKDGLMLLGMIRADFSKNMEPSATSVELDRKYHIWDVVNHRYLGFRKYFMLNFDMEPQFFAFLAQKSSGLSLDIENTTVKQGGELNVSARINYLNEEVGSNKKLPAVIHFEIFDPAGKKLEWYEKNVSGKGEKINTVFPVSFSEKPGIYTIIASEPIADYKAQASFKVGSVQKKVSFLNRERYIFL